MKHENQKRPINDNHVPCWKNIGVWAHENRRCPRLSEVIHCSNCDVFTQSARQLFDRTLPDDHQLHDLKTITPFSDRQWPPYQPVIVFQTGGHCFGFDVHFLDKVVESPSIHQIPHNRNSFVSGIVNVHGKLHLSIDITKIPVINEPVCRRHQRSGAATRMIIIADGVFSWGLSVDKVHGVYHIDTDMLEDPPVNAKKTKIMLIKYIFSMQHQRVMLLNERSLFNYLLESVR